MAIKATDMVKITPVDADGENKGMDVYVPVSELSAAGAAAVPEATETVEGTVMQAAFVADGAVPYADLTAAANHVNSILAALIAAGIMAAS